MSPRTILTLSNGKGFDLLAPRAEDIDFAVIAEHLAKENRFNGATPNICYSVAEHCVRGADAIVAMTGDRELAAYFLLHDGHEAFLKDDPTPKKHALAAVAEESFGTLASVVLEAFDVLTKTIDDTIYKAAGLQMLPHGESVLKNRIKRCDLVMFVTEWRDLMGGQDHPDWTPYADVTPLAGKIIPWSWRDARNAFLDSCYDLLPALQKVSG
jgi:uncharacterized protein